jgi:hypothetical protein
MTSAGRRSGTRALSVFHPYHIVSAADLRVVSCWLAEPTGTFGLPDCWDCRT